MPKYIVTVEFTQTRTKEINVYAPSEMEAEEKAEGIVLGWDDVIDANAVNTEEE
jgi:hypothetical protein